LNRRAFLLAPGCAALLTWMRPVRSDDKIGVDRARLDVSQPEGQVLLWADFSLALTGTLRDAVNRGLALYFVTEVEIQRGRWYWLDETVVQTQLEWRLSYHALTRQFRVATQGGRGESFGSLEDALAAMGSVKGWAIAPVSRFAPGAIYEVWVRMKLDTARLPKPFQMTALTDRDWNPQSEWKRFDFTVPTPTSAR
jgi:hypothetical protein